MFFTRDTVTLDSAELGDYAIRYEPLPGCLLKQMVPTRYSVVRADYRLELTVKAGDGGESPRIDAAVAGATGPALEFPGAAPAPVGMKTDHGWSYTVDVGSLKDERLVVQVRGGGEYLGQEQFVLAARRCHGFGFGGS